MVEEKQENGQIAQARRNRQYSSSRRLAAPRNQSRSRSGGGDFHAKPLGEASVVKSCGFAGLKTLSGWIASSSASETPRNDKLDHHPKTRKAGARAPASCTHTLTKGLSAHFVRTVISPPEVRSFRRGPPPLTAPTSLLLPLPPCSRVIVRPEAFTSPPEVLASR
jgi:hypothetical protein